MARKRVKSGSKRQKSHSMEDGINSFAEEIETLGKNFSDKMSKRYDGEAYCCGTFGIMGPFFSAMISLIVLVVMTWIIGFFAEASGIQLLVYLRIFLANNVAIFFLIFLYLAYTYHFSKACPREYKFLAPAFLAISVLIGLWLATNAIIVANRPLAIPSLMLVPGILEDISITVFWLVLLAGYLVLLLKFAKIERVTKFRTGKKMANQKKEKFSRLYRSGKERILGGVCGGLAEYFNVDPVLVRLIWIGASFIWGTGILLYIIAWIIIPRNPRQRWN